MLAELPDVLDAHVEQCEDCRARVRGYRQIAGLLAAGATTHTMPSDWKQRTLARVRAAPRARRRRLAALSAVGGVAAAMAAVLVFLIIRDPAMERSGDPKLVMQIVDDGGWRGEAHPGEEVRARAVLAGAPQFDLRVYRGARDLLVRCPGAGPPACREPDRSLLVWKVPSIGTYQVVLLVSQRPIAAPRGSLDDDVAAATAGGGRVIGVENLLVR